MLLSGWEDLGDGVLRFRDSCCVYAAIGTEGTILVNAGTGSVSGSLHGLKSPITLLLTHHFRDHTDGAIALHHAGVKVLANYWEQDYYVDPEQHFRERQIWNSYDNRWDRFAPVRPVPVDGWLMDYEQRDIAGIPCSVVPVPGATGGASAYLLELGGRRLAFTGETIYAPGKIARVSPLQYNYDDLPGIINLYHSCSRLLGMHPDRLFPSLGDPIDLPDEALAALKRNLTAFETTNPELTGKLVALPGNDVEQVLPRLFYSLHSSASTHFIASKSGRVLALDYGYNDKEMVLPVKHHRSNRRPLLHGLDGLQQRCGLRRIDDVLVTHYHDDHVAGIPLLQRLFGTSVWASSVFADLLERPERYDRPCLWHEPIRVAQKPPLGVPFRWEDVTITLYPMSGHTRYSTLILLEIDGVRVAHTGDQIFFHSGDTPGLTFSSGARLWTGHVYKNGTDLGGYQETLRHLLAFRPELVLTGHTAPYRTSDEWFSAIEDGAKALDQAHYRLLPLSEADIHFGLDSQAAELRPYRVFLPEAKRFELEGWILNPYATRARAELRVVTPEGWIGDSTCLDLEPRTRASFQLGVTPAPGVVCRRQPVALDVTINDHPFGQVTEALVTIGTVRF